MPYFHNLLISYDQLVNAHLGGWPDETLSSRCWRWHVAGKRSWPKNLVDALALCLGDKNHCQKSFESERLQRQMPPEARSTR